MTHLSIVIPVYKAEGCLDELYKRLKTSLERITPDFEVVLVEDCGGDDSWLIIQRLAGVDSRVRGIQLSRNFGQHYAITAGLDYAQGDWVVVMDCDLQDQPEEIEKLYNKAQEGFDVVFGRRYQRKDSYFKRLGSTMFYKVYDYFTDSNIDNTVANFSIISSSVVKYLRLLREQNRSYPLFINLLGFNRTNIDIEHADRADGKSTYTLKKLINLAVDSIVSHSNKPLRLSIKFGFFMTFLSLFYATWLTVRYFMYAAPVEGWTSVIVSVYFIGGLLFANMGIIGLYLGKVYDEAKNRPLYMVKETTFSKEL